MTNSPRETRDLAARLAAWLAPGDIIALNGELGSGKTEFVHGLARGLGVPAAAVASPSFTLIHEYPGRVLLAHLDLYRLEDLPAELLPDRRSISKATRCWRWNGPSAWQGCFLRTTWKCGWPS